MIDVTNVNLKDFAKKVYDLSVPQGLGFLHAQAGGLNDEETKKLVTRWSTDHRFALSMDYVHGRACKMNVFRENGKLEINDTWYDHTNSQLQELLDAFGLTRPEDTPKHGAACNCGDCK